MEKSEWLCALEEYNKGSPDDILRVLLQEQFSKQDPKRHAHELAHFQEDRQPDKVVWKSAEQTVVSISNAPPPQCATSEIIDWASYFSCRLKSAPVRLKCGCWGRFERALSRRLSMSLTIVHALCRFGLLHVWTPSVSSSLSCSPPAPLSLSSSHPNTPFSFNSSFSSALGSPSFACDPSLALPPCVASTVPSPSPSDGDSNIHIHIMGAESSLEEAPHLLYHEIQNLAAPAADPVSVHIWLIGPSLKGGESRMTNGRTHIHFFTGLYHEFVASQKAKEVWRAPTLAIAFNSGVNSAKELPQWLPTLQLLLENEIPTVLTSYSIADSRMIGRMLEARNADILWGPETNPFRDLVKVTPTMCANNGWIGFRGTLPVEGKTEPVTPV